MTTRRLLIVQIMLLLGFSSIFLLPPSPKSQPVGVKLELPEFLGDWYGTDSAVTTRELAALGPGTEFARKLYADGRGDEVYVSIVLSGQDMNTSIHRPERCLPAQGWTMVDSRVIPIAISPNETLRVTRLHDFRQVTQSGQLPVKVYSLAYYWFIGYSDLTPSHTERTWIDIRDRILKGYNQRWAYVMITSTITEGLTQFGRNEQQTDDILQTFVQKLFPLIRKPS